MKTHNAQVSDRELISWILECQYQASWTLGAEDRPHIKGAGHMLIREMFDLYWARTVKSLYLSLAPKFSDGSRKVLRIGNWDPPRLHTKLVDYNAVFDENRAAIIAHEIEANVSEYFVGIETALCAICNSRFYLERDMSLSQYGEWVCSSCASDLCKTRSEKSDTSGFVYAIGSHEYGFYKIGYSKIPPTRLSDIKKQAPFPIELLHCIPSSDCVSAERQAHEFFSEYRKEKEWFELPEEQYSVFESWALYSDGRFKTR